MDDQLTTLSISPMVSMVSGGPDRNLLRLARGLKLTGMDMMILSLVASQRMPRTLPPNFSMISGLVSPLRSITLMVKPP